MRISPTQVPSYETMSKEALHGCMNPGLCASGACNCSPGIATPGHAATGSFIDNMSVGTALNLGAAGVTAYHAYKRYGKSAYLYIAGYAAVGYFFPLIGLGLVLIQGFGKSGK